MTRGEYRLTFHRLPSAARTFTAPKLAKSWDDLGGSPLPSPSEARKV
jgi:hypothetical protein